jgi:anti-anti-sigma factor
MKLTIEHQEIAPAVTQITLTGRLMLGPESAELETLMGQLLGNGTKGVIIEMSHVTHIDSTGIGRCISCLNKTMQAGAKLYMAGAKGAVREGFRVTRLDRMFRFVDDVAAARAALGV